MKIETLKDRIEKKETAIEKKQNTIAKKSAQIAKKSEYLAKKYGINAETFNKYERSGFSDEDGDDIYWTMCDIDFLKEDIERGKNEIEAMKETLKKLQSQLAGEIKKESMFITEIPEALKELEAELIKVWDRFDIEKRDSLKKVYSELGYNAFTKTHKYSEYKFMKRTDEEIHKENANFARMETLDLYTRVKDVTGTITDWSYVKLTQGNTFPVLNGTVTGTEGKAIVESITAGGYNIQRLHIRTLVHSI